MKDKTIEDDDIDVKCDECKNNVECDKQSIHIVYKGDSTNPEEEITLCTWCFQDMEEYFKDNDYNCDDWDLENESDNN